MSSNDVRYSGRISALSKSKYMMRDSQTRLLARRTLAVGAALRPHRWSPRPASLRRVLPRSLEALPSPRRVSGSPSAAASPRASSVAARFAFPRISSARTFRVAAFYHRRLIRDTPGRRHADHDAGSGDQIGSRISPCSAASRWCTPPSAETVASTPRPLSCVPIDKHRPVRREARRFV